VLKGELHAALHTLAGVATGEVPVVVTGCGDLVALNLTANGTYSVILATLGTGSIGVFLNVPLVNFIVVDLYFLDTTAAVSAVYLLKTVGLCNTVGLGNYFFLAPESVSLGINVGSLGIVVVAIHALENSNSGFAAGSRYKLGMPEEVLFILVDARAAYVTAVIGVYIGALGEDLAAVLTLMIVILINVIGENLVAKVTLVILVYVNVIADGLTADITCVVVIFINAYAELLTAYVTHMIGVIVRAL
jgi:hypothetical protein